jgi:small subunit ribosomal protein S16
VAVKIRLKRLGKIRSPHYRIVVADSRTKRDGRVIEEIGKYHPTEDPSFIEVRSERAQYWLGVGAQPTEQVEAILKLTGDWATFKGEKGTSSVKTKEPKAAFVAETKKSVIKTKPKKAAKAKEEPERAPAEEPEGATAEAEVATDETSPAKKTAEAEKGVTPEAEGVEEAGEGEATEPSDEAAVEKE